MKRRIVEILVVVVAFGAASFAAKTAEACSWGYCADPADLIPAVDEAVVPGNASVVWAPRIDDGDTDQEVEELVLVDDTGQEVDVEIEAVDFPRFHGGPTPRVVTPLEPLDAGTQYTFSTSSTECLDGEEEVPVEATFTAEETADLPDELGTLTASEFDSTEMRLAEDAGCSHMQDVVATDVELELDEAAAPWEDALVFETVVDGELWTPADFSGQGPALGTSWVGRGEDLVFAICNEDPYSEHSYLLPGTHTVQMAARIPGTDVTLESNELTLDFDCDAAGEEPDEGDESDDDSGSETSSGACSTGGSSSPGSILLFATLLGFLVINRRRSRGRRTVSAGGELR